ncbi:hypothetical protein G6F46_013165 [Rhizopus delemar]|nr:hypothetical protein G6F46_013165 [Rhizopus delemar]
MVTSTADVGIVTDTETGAFLGSGYAVLDCSPDPTQTDPFLELTHAIEWVDTSDSAELSSVFIHAYWKDMPTYCKYCHELGHSAIQCKDAPSNKRTCFYCFKPGHIRAQCPDKVALGKRRKGNHSPSVSHELDPPVNTVTTDNTASDTTALEVFNTEVSQYATNVTLDGALTNDSSDSTDSNQSFTVYRQHSTDPLFEQSNLSQYANVDKTSNENTPHTLVEEMDLQTRPASPSDHNPTQEFMDISSDEDLLDTHVISPAMKNTLTSKAHQTSTATPIRKSNRRPKPRQIMNL